MDGNQPLGSDLSGCRLGSPPCGWMR